MTAAFVLVIESTRAKRSSFTDALKKRYEVVSVTSGKQALTYARERTPQVIVLDAISMRTPGERIVVTLKETLPKVGLIHLHPGPKAKTAGSSPADVVLFQPFTARKLINSIERFVGSSTNDNRLTCGPFSMDLDRRVLLVKGQETPLTPKLALLVELFLRHPRQTIDRKTLMERVWQTDYMGDTRTLNVHIRWFRSAIENDPSHPRYLMTVRGVGYRLDIPDGASAPVKRKPTEIAVRRP
jgi:DNA-binding response OmpR family regulator